MNMRLLGIRGTDVNYSAVHYEKVHKNVRTKPYETCFLVFQLAPLWVWRTAFLILTVFLLVHTTSTAQSKYKFLISKYCT